MQASTYLPKVILEHFGPASTLLHHSVSSWDRSSNFGALGLRWWGSPEQINPSEGFWSRILVGRAIAFVNFYTLDWLPHVCALPEHRLQRRHVLKYTTQLSCIWSSAPYKSVFQLMTDVTLYNELPRSVVTFVTVDNRLPCSILQVILLEH